MSSSNALPTIGMDSAEIKKIKWQTALKRIVYDQKSDFIYAPHLAFIYNKAGDDLIKYVKSSLKSGNYNVGLPVTVEVQKSFRIKSPLLKRLGPNLSRPGSILMPQDRILYQALSDEAVEIIKNQTDNKKSFSHKISDVADDNLFVSTRKCWGGLQERLSELSSRKTLKYILKIDVSNFFGSINQHTLINTLRDAGYGAASASVTEKILTIYTGDKSSRGILQGLGPSDLLGNFYLTPVDQFLADKNIESARYVDDIYIFIKTADDAERLLRELVPFLRGYDLVLNEAKCALMPKSALIAEEPDLERLFQNAVAEVSAQISDSDFDVDYGFQSDWDDIDEEKINIELELEATKILFDSIYEYSGDEESIERFCLPLFTRAESEYAVEHVKESFKKRPSMSQIYASYLSKFLDNIDIYNFLLSLVGDDALTDWQRMWIMAALMQVDPANNSSVNAVTKNRKKPEYAYNFAGCRSHFCRETWQRVSQERDLFSI